MTVLSAGYPFARVEPDAVGGAEQVLCAVDAAMVRAGFRSVVLAPAGSVVRGELRPTDRPDGPLTPGVMRAARSSYAEALVGCIRRERPDVVHLHGVDAAEYLPPPMGVPIVVTLHLWPDAYPPDLFRSHRPDVHFVCVSDAQQAACPKGPPYEVIRNGVDLEFYQPRSARRPAVLLLGRICPEKGFHLAIDAAKDAGLPVLIGGAVFPYAAHEEYFRSQIQPRLDDRVAFVGPVGRHAKRRLLGAVACVAVPTVVRETSSLVSMEALASGTPVVAFRTPALEELIETGRSGYLVNDVHEMRDAFSRIGRISAQECRRAAESRCAVEAMTARYLRLYREL
jgi:glycosyltransferase involved in cell wall biosynthesis